YVYNRINPLYSTAWNSAGALREVSEGIFGTNNISIDRAGTGWLSTLDDVYVTIPHILGFQGDRTATFKLDTPSYADVFYLGGEDVPLGTALAGAGRAMAQLAIIEADVQRGAIGFSSPAFSVNENGTNAVITLIRTNGS